MTVAGATFLVVAPTHAQTDLLKMSEAFKAQADGWKQYRDAEQRKLNALQADLAKTRADSDVAGKKEKFEEGQRENLVTAAPDVAKLFEEIVAGHFDPMTIANNAKTAMDVINNVNDGSAWTHSHEEQEGNLAKISQAEHDSDKLQQSISVSNQALTLVAIQAQNLRDNTTPPSSVAAWFQQAAKAMNDAATRQNLRLHPLPPPRPRPRPTTPPCPTQYSGGCFGSPGGQPGPGPVLTNPPH